MELLGLDQANQTAFQTLLLISLLTFPFKGLALWKAAGHKQKIWFIVLLIVNTLGILDIIYYFFIDGPQTKKSEKN